MGGSTGGFAAGPSRGRIHWLCSVRIGGGILVNPQEVLRRRGGGRGSERLCPRMTSTSQKVREMSSSLQSPPPPPSWEGHVFRPHSLHVDALRPERALQSMTIGLADIPWQALVIDIRPSVFSTPAGNAAQMLLAAFGFREIERFGTCILFYPHLLVIPLSDQREQKRRIEQSKGTSAFIFVASKNRWQALPRQ